MSKTVNLRQARKQRARKARSESGDVNAVAFGRTKAERGLTEARNSQQVQRLDGHKRERPSDDD